MHGLSRAFIVFDFPGSRAGRDGVCLTKTTAKTTTKTV